MTIIRDAGRFHITPWGGGQVTIPKELAKQLPWHNSQKLLMVFKDNNLTITEL